MSYSVEIIKNICGAYLWRLKSKNRRILSRSEIYASKDMCSKTAKKLARALKCPVKFIDEEAEAIE